MRLAAVLVLTACGRIGFDGATTGDGGPDTGTTVALCDPHTVTTLNVAGDPTRIRAMVADIGYVVAIGTSVNNIYVARVPSSLDSADVHLPLAASYTLGGVAHIGDATFVQAAAGGVSYLKLLDPTFDSYSTVESTDEILFDPPLAPRVNGKAWRVARFSGFLEVAEMDAAGGKSGLVANYAPSGTAATIDANRVVYEIGERCETFLVDDTGTTQKLHTWMPCTQARVAVLDSGAAIVVHRLATNQLQLHSVPDDPALAGKSLAIGDVKEARIAAAGNKAWVMVQKQTDVILGSYDSELAGSAAIVPEVTGAYALTRSAVFWLEGTALRVGTPCLR